MSHTNANIMYMYIAESNVFFSSKLYFRSMHCNCCTIALFNHLGYYFIKHTLHFMYSQDRSLHFIHSHTCMGWRFKCRIQTPQRSSDRLLIMRFQLGVVFRAKRSAWVHWSNWTCRRNWLPGL